jgi:hypothetical protein
MEIVADVALPIGSPTGVLKIHVHAACRWSEDGNGVVAVAIPIAGEYPISRISVEE